MSDRILRPIEDDEDDVDLDSVMGDVDPDHTDVDELLQRLRLEEEEEEEERRNQNGSRQVGEGSGISIARSRSQSSDSGSLYGSNVPSSQMDTWMQKHYDSRADPHIEPEVPSEVNPFKQPIQAHETLVLRPSTPLDTNLPLVRDPTKLKYEGDIPPIIEWYHDSKTGYPNFSRMRGDITRPSGSVSPASLSERGRAMTRDLNKYGTNFDRMYRKIATKRVGDKRLKVMSDGRFVIPSEVRPNRANRRLLVPQNPEAPELNDRRFYRPIRDMGRERVRTQVMPTGRIGYGDLSQFNIDQIRRDIHMGRTRGLTIPGVQHEDSSDWTPTQVAFYQRLRSLNPEDLRRYLDMQIESNMDSNVNRAAMRRMVPRPSIGQLRSRNEQEVSRIRHQAQHDHYHPRFYRREQVWRRSALPSAINLNDVFRPLETISESEYDPFIFTPLPRDRNTNLIPTTRSVMGLRSSTLATIPEEREQDLFEELGRNVEPEIEQAEEVFEDVMVPRRPRRRRRLHPCCNIQ